MDENNKTLPELLAPAGNFLCLKAAAEAGCDAVYIGGKAFSARQGAENFSDAELSEAVDYCHLRGVKCYVAVNTLLLDAELSSVLHFVRQMAAVGADAFIVQDVGMAAFLREQFPEIKLHASTQMTVADADSARFLQQQGFKRVVLPRELSLAEIAEISNINGLETEVFVHGALCVCYSGQCLLSAKIGGRSGNRGACAQPCRLAWTLLKDGGRVESGHLLSPKDLMTLDMLPDIIASGVSSLKIEGRMKSPEYVYLATKTYREQLARVAAGKPFVPSRDIDRLLQVFNRGGSFTPGYFKNHAGRDMMSTQTPKATGTQAGVVSAYDRQVKMATIDVFRDLVPGDGIEVWTDSGPHAGTGLNRAQRAMTKLRVSLSGQISPGNPVYLSFDKTLNDELKHAAAGDTRQRRALCSIKARIGQPLEMSVSCGGVSVSAFGDAVQAAVNQPVPEADVLAQIGKTGGTPFALEFAEVDIDGGIFIGKAQLNNLRREALTKLANALVLSAKRDMPAIGAPDMTLPKTGQTGLSVYVSGLEQFAAACVPGVDRIYMEAAVFLKQPEAFASAAEAAGADIFAALPGHWAKTGGELIDRLEKSPATGYLCRTFGHFKQLAGSKKNKSADVSFNVMNKLSAAYLLAFAGTVCLSHELSPQEAAGLCFGASETVVYGRLPLMTTRQCPVGLYAGSKQGGKYCKLQNNAAGYALKDRKDAVYLILTDCEACCAFILDSRAEGFGKTELPAHGLLRLHFSTETPAEVSRVVSDFVLGRA